MADPTPTSALAGAAQAAAQLADVGWDDLPAEDLPAAAATLARARAVLDAALVSVAGRLEKTDAAAEAGWASGKDFLTHLTGGRKGAGAGLLRVAGRTADLPVVWEAFAVGDLSLAQAGVIGDRIATLPQLPELRERAPEQMVALATGEGRDATDLDRAFAGIVADLDPDGTILATDLDRERAERGAHHARHLSLTPDGLGGVRIKGYATIEDVELVKATLMPLAAPVTTEPGACGGDPAAFGVRDPQGRRTDPGCPTPGCAHTGRDVRDAGARLWDALVEACRRLQATDQLPTAHGTTARITVAVDYDTLTAGLGEGLLGTGESISAQAARRLACDAEIIPTVLGSQSQLLDIGRSERLVTTPLWLALVQRDRHCAFPGCERLPLACDAHHIDHWADGGTTSLDNLILLCRRHHTITHHSPWTVTIDPLTRQPAWTPPPQVDDRGRFTYHPAA